jgi:hypothetical protein
MAHPKTWTMRGSEGDHIGKLNASFLAKEQFKALNRVKFMPCLFSLNAVIE